VAEKPKSNKTKIQATDERDFILEIINGAPFSEAYYANYDIARMNVTTPSICQDQRKCCNLMFMPGPQK